MCSLSTIIHGLHLTGSSYMLLFVTSVFFLSVSWFRFVGGWSQRGSESHAGIWPCKFIVIPLYHVCESYKVKCMGLQTFSILIVYYHLLFWNFFRIQTQKQKQHYTAEHHQSGGQFPKRHHDLHCDGMATRRRSIWQNHGKRKVTFTMLYCHFLPQQLTASDFMVYR